MEEIARPVFLLTDFGTRDTYAGQLRAVLAGLSPRSPVFDLTHEVEPGAVEEGAWMLEAALPALPETAITVAVVDPGVGTGRRALAVVRGRQLFLGPDNGLLSGPLAPGCPRDPAGSSAIEITSPRFRRPTVSPTFHGRDIFAAAAGHLAAGLDYRQLGPPAPGAVLLAPFAGEPAGFGTLRGHVVHVDRFGNCITTIRAAQLFPAFVTEFAGAMVDRCVHTFADAPAGAPFCYAESAGFLAIALNGASAAEHFGARRGDPVLVRAT